MGTYALRASHTSDQCPITNAKVRALVEKTAPEMPKLAEKLGIKFVVGPLVLGAEHEAIAVLEAENVEAINDFILQSGMAQWNSIRVTMATPMGTALGELSSLPPPIY